MATRNEPALPSPWQSVLEPQRARCHAVGMTGTTPHRAPRREELDTALGPCCLQPTSAPPQLAYRSHLATYCSGKEQSPQSTPKRAHQFHLQHASSAPPAVCAHGGGPIAHDLSILDIGAIRDDSVAVSSTVDTHVQVCTVTKLLCTGSGHQSTVRESRYRVQQQRYMPRLSPNHNTSAENVQQIYSSSPVAFDHQNAAGEPHLYDRSPALQYSSSRLPHPGFSNRHDSLDLAQCSSVIAVYTNCVSLNHTLMQQLCREKHAATIDRISHDKCHAEMSQLRTQNSDLQSQLQTVTEQMTAMHGQVQQAARERCAFCSNSLGQLGSTFFQQWADQVQLCLCP